MATKLKYRYQKGTNAERELIEMFWNNGYAALRGPGSGVSRRPCPDVVAGNGEKYFAIESKSSTQDYVHLTYDEIVKLVTFAQTFGAIPYVAVRFEGRDWVFLDIGKIQYTKGKNFKVSKKFAYTDGKRFEELIELQEEKKLE
ncbi:MAG: Holliday junction resolvase Hjc [archaeon]